MKEYLSLPEVQEHLGIRSRKTVLKLIRRGDLPAFKIGGTRWRISTIDLKRFLSAQQLKVFAQKITDGN